MSRLAVELRDIWSVLKIPQQRRRDFAFILLLLVIARWQALVQYTYSVDDYRQLRDGLSSYQLLGQGRFVAAWLNDFTQTIGIDPQRAPVISIGLSCLIAAWVAIQVLTTWAPKSTLVVLLPAAAIALAHPYTSELFTFRAVTLFHYLAYGAVIAAFLLSLRPTPSRFVAAVTFFALSLGIYQVALNLYLVVLVLTVAFALLERLREDPLHAGSFRPGPALVASAFTAIGAIIVYFVLSEYLKRNIYSDPRAAMIGLGQVPERIAVLAETLEKQFIAGNAYAGILVERPLQAILWLLVVGAIMAPLFARSLQLRQRVLASGATMAAAAVAFVSCIGVLIVSQVVWLPPRVFMPVGFVWAGFFLIFWSWGSNRLRPVLLVAVWIVTFGFLAKHQQIFVDQWRVNLRDRVTAIEMLAQLRTRPGWAGVTRIYVVGSTWHFESPIATAAGNQNVSAFIELHGRAGLFTEITGRRFVEPIAEDRDRAIAFCNSADPGRKELTVNIQGELAIVCRGPP